MRQLDGYEPFLRTMPAPDALCRWRNEVTGVCWTGKALDIHPYTRFSELWWHTTGIQRMADENEVENALKSL